MPDERKVLGRRGQMLVAIPARARRALGLAPQQSVWFHYPRTGEVVLAIREEGSGGRPPTDLPCPHCEPRERELVELRARLQARQAGSGRQFFTQGYEQAVRHYGSLTDRLDLAVSLLRELAGRRARQRGGPGPLRARGRARAEVVPGPDSFAGSSAPPSPGAQVHEEERSSARPIPGPSPSPGVPEEGGVGAGRPLPGQP